MAIWSASIWGAHFWPALSALAGLLVIVSSVADRRRARRIDIEAVGFMPWTAITVFSVLATVIAAALAIKSS
jgi:hypothetical protein